MNKKTKFILIIAVITLFAIIIMPKVSVFASITPGEITGEIPGEDEIEIDFVEKLINMLRIIGTFIAVGAVMVIGRMYTTIWSINNRPTSGRSI